MPFFFNGYLAVQQKIEPWVPVALLYDDLAIIIFPDLTQPEKFGQVFDLKML